MPDIELTFKQALALAMSEEMRRDESVFLIGEDVGPSGGIFKCSEGMFEEFGPERVIDTPISEVGFVGMSVGAAMTGMRPITELMFNDFALLTMDQLVNQAAKIRYMTGGQCKVPMTLRAAIGAGRSSAAQHSQSFQAIFSHIPGLKVALPSCPRDAKGLLKTAIRDDNPVIFLEDKMMYNDKGLVPEEEDFTIPFGEAVIKREGTDVTVVATMAMVPRALTAATQLAREGISVEVVDPRTLRPLDEETILESVRKTNRLVIVHEAWTNGGFGAEVSAMVVEKAFDYLDAPIQRVGARNVPMPYNDTLEVEVIPSIERIANVIRSVM